MASVQYSFSRIYDLAKYQALNILEKMKKGSELENIWRTGKNFTLAILTINSKLYTFKEFAQNILLWFIKIVLDLEHV